MLGNRTAVSPVAYMLLLRAFGSRRTRGIRGMTESTTAGVSPQDEALTLQGFERQCRGTGADFFALLICARSVPVPA